MQKMYFTHGQHVYRAGQANTHVYIVKKGMFEQQRPLVRNRSKIASSLHELVADPEKRAIVASNKNLLGQRLPELSTIAPQDLPCAFRLV